MENLENSEELASLTNQIEEVQLKDKLGKQNFHEKKNYMNHLLVHSKTLLKT